MGTVHTKKERAKSPGVACHPGLLDPALATRGPAAVELWTHACVWNLEPWDGSSPRSWSTGKTVYYIVCKLTGCLPRAAVTATGDGYRKGGTEITAQKEE